MTEIPIVTGPLDLDRWSYLIEVERVAKRIKTLENAEFMFDILEDSFDKACHQADQKGEVLNLVLELVKAEKTKSRKELSDCLRF